MVVDVAVVYGFTYYVCTDNSRKQVSEQEEKKTQNIQTKPKVNNQKREIEREREKNGWGSQLASIKIDMVNQQ